MRLMHVFVAGVACGCVMLVQPAMAQRGHAQAPTPHAVPAAHPATPSHPTTPAAHSPSTNVAAQVAANPALSTRLQPLLPPGTTLEAAAAGFKNQGQFIAALHVSQNLHIPFSDLKSAMTGPNHESLGQAIHTLQPSANSDTATKTAEQEADTDIKASKNAPAPSKNKAHQ